MIERIFVFIFGLIAGSFFNLCIWRLPREMSIRKPKRSICPRCQKTIIWYDNIPILSYLFLQGKCRFCKEKISLRYPVVELFTAILFLALFIHFGFKVNFFVYLILTSFLIVASFIDIEHRIIPDEISIGGMIVGVSIAILRSFFGREMNLLPLYYSLGGLLCGGIVIYLTGIIGDTIIFKILKKGSIEGETESMGGGDIKLLAMIGAFLGFKKTLLTFFIAPFFGAIIGVYLLFRKKSHLIPYGPFLSLAAFISLMWGKEILRFLFG